MSAKSKDHDIMMVAVCPKCAKWIVHEKVKTRTYEGISKIVRSIICHTCLFRRFRIADICTIRDMTIETFQRAKPNIRTVCVGKNPLRFYDKHTGIDNYAIIARVFEAQRKIVGKHRKLSLESIPTSDRTKCAAITRDALTTVRDFARAKACLPPIYNEEISDICCLEDRLIEKHAKMNALSHKIKYSEIMISCWLWHIGERMLANKICGESVEKILFELEKKKIGMRMNKKMLFELMAFCKTVEEQSEIEDFVCGAQITA